MIARLNPEQRCVVLAQNDGELIAKLYLIEKIKRKTYGVCKDGTILFRKRKYNGKIYWTSASGNTRYPADEVTPVRESLEDAILRTVQEFIKSCQCEPMKLGL